MFANVGRKIKVYAKVAFWVMIVLTVLGGIIVLVDAYHEAEYITAISLIIGGPITAWITSALLYGFGEIIEKVSNIEQSLAQNVGSSTDKSKVEAFVDDVNDRVVRAAQALSKPAVHSGEMNTQHFFSNKRISGTPNDAATTEIGNIDKRCSNCGTPLDDDSAFCTKCGTPVATQLSEQKPKQRICPSCGKPVSENSAFCTKCGHQM